MCPFVLPRHLDVTEPSSIVLRLVCEYNPPPPLPQYMIEEESRGEGALDGVRIKYGHVMDAYNIFGSIV